MHKRPADNNQNLLVAALLSMAVMIGWQYFYAGPRMKAEQERVKVEREAKAEIDKQAKTPADPSALTTPRTAPVPAGASSAEAQAATREAALLLTPRVPIETPSLRGSLNLKGARIDDLVLTKYHEQVDPTSPNIVLFSPGTAPYPYFAEYGWRADGANAAGMPNRDTLWKADGATGLTPATPVTLTFDNGQGLLFKRVIAVDAEYMFNIVDQVENKSSAAVTLTPYARIYRLGRTDKDGIGVLHEGLLGYVGDKGLQEFKYSSIVEPGASTVLDNQTGGWLGVTEKYWAAALIPDQTQPYRANFAGQKHRIATEHDAYQTDYQRLPVTVQPGARADMVGNLYAGAKRAGLIETYEEKLKISHFSYMIDWGWFYFITKPLFHLMDMINDKLGNFGLTIIAITFIVKLAFFPLANKSYESMAKMKKLQPETVLIRERFKDDPARLQQETMALYKKEGVNPLSGCLPLLLQIPVFFGLYKVIYGTIDMRHAPFFGWIKDLSAGDPTSIFNLFGLLPFGVPEALHFGVWPLIMGVTMWMQMQLNPPPPDPIQAQVFAWMPLMFTVMMASFPAGLVIYWTFSNILTIAQQWYIMKKNGAEVLLLDNMKRQVASIGTAIAEMRGKKSGV